MATLHLTLKYKWYDMIESGLKPEEYREIKTHWGTRLIDVFGPEEFKGENKIALENLLYDILNGHRPDEVMKNYYAKYKTFDSVTFHRGYHKDHKTMEWEFKGIDIGTAKPEWSDNWQGDVFRIKLGNKITGETCHKCGELTGTTKCNYNH